MKNDNIEQMGQKGQVSVEYLVMSTFLLLVVGVLSAYAFFNYDQAVKLDMAQHSTDLLGEVADQAYALGTGTVLFAEIELPYGIESYAVSENEVKFVLKAFGGSSDIYAKTTADLNADSVLPTSAARHRIRVSMGGEEVSMREV